MSSQSFRRDSKAVKRKNDHRSPAEHRHSEDVTRGRDIPKSHGPDVEFDLRHVKKEPEDTFSHSHRDSHNTRHDSHHRHHASSSSPPHHRSHVNRLSPPHRRRHDDFREQREERRRNDRRRLERRAERSDNEEHWGRHSDNRSPTEAVKKEKEKPSLALSGKLTEDTNTFRGVLIKYIEPPEARKPKKHWRFYPFKGETALPVLHLHRQSAFLLGRDRRVADIPIDHPSCSKQHAALQFRMVEFTRADGRVGRRVRPYVIDLGSANGSYVNGQRIEPQRYVELFEKDVVKFGFSSREYVLLHDSSDTSALQDDEGVD